VKNVVDLWYNSQTSTIFFHAHHAVDGNDRNGLRGWEVDGGDADDAGSTARTYIRCPWDATELGPTGYTITRMLTGAGEDRPWPWNWPDDEWAGIRELRRFVDRQFHEGYLNTAGLMPLMPADRQGIVNQRGENHRHLRMLFSLHDDLHPGMTDSNQMT
jgi:hypothetical protein